MHIYFSGIGGAGIGPLALLAKQAGYDVSGSDIISSSYTEILEQKGVSLHIGQSLEQITAEHKDHSIDWIVFSSAIFYTNPNHPELQFAKNNGIKYSKRDEFLNEIITQHSLKLIAIAGTHGKTTTTALAIWVLIKLNIPISYSVGAKITSETGNDAMGQFDPNSQYFVYECDEFDRNFLSFRPFLSIITTSDWDHHDIYPTYEDYKQAFGQFIGQSQNTFLFQRDADNLQIEASENVTVLDQNDEHLSQIKLAGLHNRQNAFLVVEALGQTLGLGQDVLINMASQFPGSSRRFEKIAPNIYSDYAHTPEEISATLQLAHELSDNVIAVYEPLTNRRQHYMQDLYKSIFEPAKQVYWLPSYLAREDPKLATLTPDYLISKLSPETVAVVANKDSLLLDNIKKHAQNGNIVVCLAGGGGGSLDEWLRDRKTQLQA